MDFESENSALEYTGDNDVVCSANPPIGDDVKIGSNGSYEHRHDGCDLNSNGNGHPLPSLDPVKTNEDADKLNSDKQSEFTVVNSAGKGTEDDQPVAESPLSPPKVPMGSPGMSPPPTGTKGKGLKKWRRIRREVTKDSAASVDVTKILKRGSENLVNSLEAAGEMKQKSEGSVSLSSTNALIDNTVGADAFSVDGSSSNYEVAGGSTFSVGAADSDNSKDYRSSKSSTAASVPRSRHDPSRASGHLREKQKMKHLGGKHLGNASQRFQQGAFQVDTSKKPWVKAVSMDKENSLSSLESDSRSYSSVFMQGSPSVINNGNSERLTGYDSEHGYDGPAGEQLSVEGPPTGSNTSVRENEQVPQGDAALSKQIRGRSKNHQLSGNGDPLVDCVRMLLSAQEALEQEIQKFGELGKDLWPLDDNSIKATNLPTKSVRPDVCRSSTRDDPDALEAKSTIQAQNIHVLEKQLEEALGILKEKESRIAELEATIKDMQLSNEDLGRRVEVQQKKFDEIEAEMEGLLKQKMEAEIKYLAVEDKRIIAEKQMNLLLVEQKALIKTDHSERRATMSEVKADELSSQTEIGKMRKRSAKFSYCFFIQLILFIFVLQFFVSQFLPNSEMVMPT